MHPYDIGMIAVILIATIFGAVKGMAWQIASLASLAVSYVLALRSSEHLAPYFGSEAPWNRFAAMLVVYLVTSAVIWLVYRRVKTLIERVKLSEWDRQAGAVFGAVKGVLFSLAITFFAVTLSPKARDTVLQTHSGYFAGRILEESHAVMPKELHEVLHPYMHPLEDGDDRHTLDHHEES